MNLDSFNTCKGVDWTAFKNGLLDHEEGHHADFVQDALAVGGDARTELEPLVDLSPSSLEAQVKSILDAANGSYRSEQEPSGNFSMDIWVWDVNSAPPQFASVHMSG